MMKSTRIAAMAALMSMLVVGASFAAYTTDNMDYTIGQNFADDALGQWDANTNSVVVTNDAAVSGQSMFVATDASASNHIDEASPTKVWTDFRIRPMLGVAPTSGIPASASAVIYFDSTGWVGVYTGTVFTVCSNSIWGDPLPQLTASDFAEISIFQNFAAGVKQSVVFVNGVAVMQDVPFNAGASLSYNYFVVANVESNAWLDDVRVQATYDPSGLAQASNANNNAWQDADEVQTYGYLGRTLNIGTEYTFNTALDTFRPNDILYVHSGNYNESFSVPTNVTFTGDSFVLNGDISFDGAYAATFESAFVMTGNVSVAASATLNVSGTLSVTGNVDLAAGATFDASGAVDVSGYVNNLDNSSFTVAGATTIGGPLTLGDNATFAATGATGNLTVGDTITAGTGSSIAALSVTTTGTGGLAFTGTASLDATNNVTIAGAASIGIGGSLTAGGALQTGGTLAIGDGATVTAASVVTTVGNIELALNATLESAGIVTAADDITLLAGATLNAGGDITADNLTSAGNVVLAASKTMNISILLTLSGTGTLTANSGSQVNTVGLDLQDNSQLDVVSADLDASTANVNLHGTFTIYGDMWPGPAVVTLPFQDDFELYSTLGDASMITNYGFFGWYTTHTNVKVVAGAGYSGKGLILPDGTTVSNRVDAQGAEKIWTEYYVKANRGVSPSTPQTANASFLGFVNTNGYMEVYTNATKTKVCDSGVGLSAPAVSKMASNVYRRVDIFVDTGTGEFALLVDGVVVAQQLPFPGTMPDYTSLIAEANDGDSYLDNILITTDLPSGLTLDTDGNTLPDGYEIHQYGYIGKSPLGSLFKFQ